MIKLTINEILVNMEHFCDNFILVLIPPAMVFILTNLDNVIINEIFVEIFHFYTTISFETLNI